MDRSSHHDHRQSNIQHIIVLIYADQQTIDINYLQQIRHMVLQHINDNMAVMLDVSSSQLEEQWFNLQYFLFSDSNEDLSYEDLISLAESIGGVGSRLSEEEIMGHLKTTTIHVSAATASANQEPDICVICQAEYENDETIGTLKCGHDYHADCIKKWLLEKNACPMCNSTAVS